MWLSKEQSVVHYFHHMQFPPIASWLYGDVHPEAPLDFQQGKQTKPTNKAGHDNEDIKELLFTFATRITESIHDS